MIKSNKETKARQQPSNLRKEQSSCNTIVNTLPNNIPHPKIILLTPSSSVSSIAIEPYPTKKTHKNKVDNFLQQMKTRITLNIKSTAQFPPLNLTIKNNLSNDMSDGSSSNEKLVFQHNKQNNNTKEHQSKESNEESNKQKNINKVQNKTKDSTKTNKLNLIRQKQIKVNKVKVQRELKVNKKNINKIFT